MELLIDSTAFLAVLFEEPKASEVLDLLKGAQRAYASALLEAEVRSAAIRKGLPMERVDAALTGLVLVQPDRPLAQELKAVCACGVFLRGADLWHLACALHLTGDPSALPFVTLDRSQALAASRLGFQVLPEFPSGSAAQEAPAAYRTRPEKASRVRDRKPLRRKK